MQLSVFWRVAVGLQRMPLPGLWCVKREKFQLLDRDLELLSPSNRRAKPSEEQFQGPPVRIRRWLCSRGFDDVLSFKVWITVLFVCMRPKSDLKCLAYVWQAESITDPKWTHVKPQQLMQSYGVSHGTLEPFGTFTWNPYNLGTPWNLYAITLLGTLGPSETLPFLKTSPGPFNWNTYLEPPNLLEPLLGIFTWNLYLEPLLGTLEPSRTFTWNPSLKTRNLPEPLLGTLAWNLGTFQNLYLEPFLLENSEPSRTFAWYPYLEPRNLPEPLLGTLIWNLGTSQNLAGWLPQSAPGPSLAATPKLSAFGETFANAGDDWRGAGGHCFSFLFPLKAVEHSYSWSLPISKKREHHLILVTVTSWKS